MTPWALFLEGLLSFFSPCVLPLVPLYIGYLTAEAKDTDEDGNVIYRRGQTMKVTAGFVLGICTVFVLAGLGSSAIRRFFTGHLLEFQIAGGILLVLAGLFALHIIDIPFLSREHRKTVNLQGKMGFFKAFLTGFFFSFAWSPCIGPMLAQAIVLAASQSAAQGWLYIACYAAGFILIFLLLGIFTSEILQFLRKYRNITKYTGIISGIIILCMGFWMFAQASETLRSLQSSPQNTAAEASQESGESAASQTAEEDTAGEDPDVYNYGFTLIDAQGNEVTLSDYKGQTILVNFFGTWCGYCKMELPALQNVTDTRDDVQVILIAAPGYNGEGDIAYVENWMKENNYDMMVLYDSDFAVTRMYQVSGYPSTYIVRPDGTFLGYMPGYMDENTMQDILEQAAQ